MSDVIQDYPVHHAGIRPVMHPGLGVTVNGQTAVRYLRFLRPVRLDAHPATASVADLPASQVAIEVLLCERQPCRHAGHDRHERLSVRFARCAVFHQASGGRA